LVHWQSGIPKLNGPVLKKNKKIRLPFTGQVERWRKSWGEGFSKGMREET